MRRLGCGQLLVLLLLPAAAGTGEIPNADLAHLKNVGREGQGNEEAGRAWKDVVARGPTVLPALLRAMDDADAAAANWLRTAGDAVVENALAAGKPLPTETLEQFVRQTRHNGAARRLAYEWLCRIDAKTPERLLPGMLQDPSPELRRDAVAAVLKEARNRLDQKNEDAARAAYRRALTGACDKDQVDHIVKELGKLGVKIDVAAHFGFVRQWLLIAPFDNHNDAGFNVAYPPEKSVDPTKGIDPKVVYKGKDSKEVHWIAATTADPYGVVNLNKELGKHKGAVAYAYAVIESPKERSVQIRAGSVNGIKIFLNSKELYHRDEYHHGMDIDQHIAKGTLKAGRNQLLVKVCQNEQTEEWAQDWNLQVRLCDAVGAAVPFSVVSVRDNKKQNAN